MEILSFIIPFVVLLTVVVFIHEYGHYYFAKRYGVGVTDFSIGFGKELFGFNDRSGTRWKKWRQMEFWKKISTNKRPYLVKAISENDPSEMTVFAYQCGVILVFKSAWIALRACKTEHFARTILQKLNFGRTSNL